MNCREARQQLWSARGGTPGAELEIHLHTCGACAAAASEVQRLRSWLHELPAEEPSAQFDWRLRLRLAQVAQETPPALLDRPSGRFAWRAPMQFAMSTAVAALLVLAVGMVWTRTRVTPAPTGQVVVQTPSTPLRQGPGPDVVQVRRGSAPAPLPGATARSDSDSSFIAPQR